MKLTTLEIMQALFIFGLFAAVSGIDFGIVVIPDTQYYSGWYPETFEEQCNWICACSESKNILFDLDEKWIRKKIESGCELTRVIFKLEIKPITR